MGRRGGGEVETRVGEMEEAALLARGERGGPLRPDRTGVEPQTIDVNELRSRLTAAGAILGRVEG